MKVSLLLAMFALLGLCTAAQAQQSVSFAPWDHEPHLNSRGEDTNGPPYRERCDGLSYGTGDHSCGTATGGPVGGLPGRN